jgi:hypothetical protein
VDALLEIGSWVVAFWFVHLPILFVAALAIILIARLIIFAAIESFWVIIAIAQAPTFLA